MDLNHRSPGYEPDGISRLPHLAEQGGSVPILEPDCADATYILFVVFPVSDVIKRWTGLLQMGYYNMYPSQPLCLMQLYALQGWFS
jgi:hypothetical protein